MDKPTPWMPPSPPLPAFHTKRLTLRFWEPSDAASMLEGLNVDRDAYLPWLPWVSDDNRTLEECNYNIVRFQKARERTTPPPDDFVLGIFDRVTGAAVGGTGLHRMHLASHTGEIGYYIRPDRRRQGLCTEAVAGLISWAFTPQPTGWNLRKIEIFCAGSNTASQSVPRSLGLRQEVHQLQHRWVEGRGWDDTLGWGVLRDEWDIGNHSLKRV